MSHKDKKILIIICGVFLAVLAFIVYLMLSNKDALESSIGTTRSELRLGDTSSCQAWELQSSNWSGVVCGLAPESATYGLGAPSSSLSANISNYYQYEYAGADECRGACGSGNTTCYKTKTWTRQCPHNCPAGYFFDLNSGECQECGIANYGAGYYCPGGDGTAPINCPSNYPKSSGVGHNDTSISSCYIDVQAGYGVASSGANKEMCEEGYYYPSARNVYYGNVSACIKCNSAQGTDSLHTTCLLDRIIYATGITVTPTSATVNVGETVKLTETLDSGNPDVQATKTVKYTSSNPSIATVGEVNGIVTGVAPGTATITVTAVYGNKTATSTITVICPSGTTNVNGQCLSSTAEEACWCNQDSTSCSWRIGATSTYNLLRSDASNHSACCNLQGKIYKDGNCESCPSGTTYVNGQCIGDGALKEITGNNVIAIAADVGSVTGSYGAHDTGGALIKVDWSASGSGATFDPTSNATSFRTTFKHQGSPSAGNCPIVTDGQVTATKDSTTKTYSVKVHSYCAWTLVDTNKGPFDSQIGAPRDSMKFVVGCDAYEGWYQESGKWYYVNHYNRCCGSSSPPQPSDSACYGNAKTIAASTAVAWLTGPTTNYPYLLSGISQSDCIPSACYSNGTDYKWLQKKNIPTGYSEVPGITSESKCAPEEPHCYIIGGQYKWGNYATTVGATLVSSIKKESDCKTPTSEYACYKNADDDYVWTTSAPTGYTKVSEITSATDCTRPTPPACYLHNGKYEWGEYSTTTGYVLVGYVSEEKYCKAPSEACYSKNGKYYWGEYSTDPNYKLVPEVQNANDCGVSTPEAGANRQVVMYAFMILLVSFGIFFVYYNNLSRKKVN